MGLQEVIEETKKQLEEAIKAEEGEQAEEIVKEEPKEEPKKEEVVAKEEPKEEPTKTVADHVRERKEKVGLKAEVEAANRKIDELTAIISKVVKPETPTNEEPSRAEDPAAWAEWKIQQQDKALTSLNGWKEKKEREEQEKNLNQRADNEIMAYQEAAKKKFEDFEDVKKYQAVKLGMSIKNLAPNISDQQLIETVWSRMKSDIIRLYREGHENPVEAMYSEIKASGYQPPAKELKEDKEDVVKPDLDRVAKNRARNAGTAAAQGDSGRGELTLAVAAQMTNREFSRLKPEDKRLILGG
jgi:hypothetical protein